MKVYLLTFAEGEVYIKSRQNMDETKDICQVDSHTMWNYEKIKQTKFYLDNKKILDNKDGFGYYIWKPYIILEKLKELNDGDYLFYQDASRYETDGFKNSCREVVNFMNRFGYDILTGMTLKENYNYQMIKPSCLDFFNLNNDDFKQKYHILTCPLFIKKNSFTMNFVREWLECCCVEDNVSYMDLSHLGGQRNMYDQAVFNCLLYKYKIAKEGMRSFGKIKSPLPDSDDEMEYRKFTYYFDFFMSDKITLI